MRHPIREEVIIGACIALVLESAVIADAAGASALKWLTIGMAVAGAVALAVKRRW